MKEAYRLLPTKLRDIQLAQDRVKGNHRTSRRQLRTKRKK